MIRSSLTSRAGILPACLALLLLAACGQTQQPATQAAAVSGWQRPSSYEPPGRPGDPWGPWISQASRRFDVPELWIREVMRQESGGRASATSRAGAMGLMQVMPGTYRELQAQHGLGPDPYHPWDSLMAGTAYLRQMYELYGNPAFLAAYNAGPRRLEDYLWGNRGLPNETRNYVARVGPRIQGIRPIRPAAPEVYAAAEIPFDVPAGPRRGDAATMLALREQSRSAPARFQMAQVPHSLPPGPVVRMDPIPDGSTYTPPPTQFAAAGSPNWGAAGGTVVAMSPIVSPGDTMRMEPIVSPGDTMRMEPIVSVGDPGTVRAEPLAPARGMAVAAAPTPVARGFSLIPQAHAGTLAVPQRGTTATPAGVWGIQVGAFASENLARAAAGQARDQVASMGTRPAVEPVSQARSTLFRARVMGLGSRSAAEQACDRLRSRGSCLVVAPGA